MNKKVFPILLAFLCMGFGDLGGPLKSLFEETFGLSSTLATVTTTMLTFGMFGLLAIPMGIVQYRKGKAFVLSLGLLTAVAGMIFPLFQLTLPTAVIALLLLGAGAAMLQVSGNPVMRDVSLEGKFSRNLSIAQAFKSVGTLSTALIPLLAATFITKDTGWINKDNTWRLLFPIFGFVLLVTGIWFLTLKVEEKADEKAGPTTFASCFKALANPYIAIMTFSIFIYVGIEVCIFANSATYLRDVHGFDASLLATVVVMLSLIVGRIAGGVILDKFNPKAVFVVTTVLSIIGFAGFLIPGSMAVTWGALVLSGLGLANIFPLIFSITIDDRPDMSNEISGLMVTAIIGGAVVPLVHSAISDLYNSSVYADGHAGSKLGVLFGFLWPIALLLVILVVAISVYAKSKKKGNA